ncbi:MAG: C-terminal helicase domain-containing protein [Candidatus Limnocylindria bacterium]
MAELRRLLARSCIAALEPDLIILDEFQRFRHLLEPPNPDDPDDIRSLAHELFSQQGAKVLMLSATPYKMYTLSDEADDDHYRDFVQTSKFLLGTQAAAGFGRDLTAFRRALYRVGDGLDLDEAIRLKSRIERRLRNVMARTERLSVTEDRSGMLIQQPSRAMQLEEGDLSSFLLADELSRKLGTPDALEYWKSAPYLTNFMEGYKLKREIREAIADGPKQNADVIDLLRSAVAGGLLSFDEIRAYERVDPGNARLRSLMADTIDRDTWQLLWMPASMPYYEPGPPFDEPRLTGFTKRLVFSSWQVAPQAISVLLSYEAERRMVRKGHRRRINTPEARQRQRGLLRFARDSRNQERLVGMPVFALLYPSPTMARLGDPLRIAASGEAGLPGRGEVIDSVKRELTRRLRPLMPRRDDGPVDENWYWAAPLLLDAQADPDLIEGWLGRSNAQAVWDAGEAGSDAESAFAAHVDFARSAAHQAAALGQPPDDLLDVLARLAVAGPANTALRSLARAVGDVRRVDSVPVRDAAARIGWGFRALFNVPEVMALVRTSKGGDEAYWRAVLEYCFAGNLQAVLDEYLHVLPEWLGLVDHHEESQLADIAREVHDVVSVRAANYGVEELVDRDGGLSLETQKVRARYALRFGVRATDEEASLHRAGLVRSAFNSPFWPFVLASTSLGQEGLDFHQYCHAVVHWNLPANPVDMEQREGRVHRYK